MTQFLINISLQITPKCLFEILSSLEKDIPDCLDILALVEASKPLKPLVSMESIGTWKTTYVRRFKIKKESHYIDNPINATF